MWHFSPQQRNYVRKTKNYSLAKAPTSSRLKSERAVLFFFLSLSILWLQFVQLQGSRRTKPIQYVALNRRKEVAEFEKKKE